MKTWALFGAPALPAGSARHAAGGSCPARPPLGRWGRAGPGRWPGTSGSAPWPPPPSSSCCISRSSLAWCGALALNALLSCMARMDDAGPMRVASGSRGPAPDHQLEVVRAAGGGAKLEPGVSSCISAEVFCRPRELAGQQLISAPVVSKIAHWPPAAVPTSASTALSDPPDRAALAHRSASSHDCRVRANRSASRTLVTKRCSCSAGTTLGTSNRGIPWALAASTSGVGISRCATPVTKAIAQTGTPASRST